jgi:hypothetical protein
MGGTEKARAASKAALLLGAFVVTWTAFLLYSRFGFPALAGIGSDSMAVHLDFDIFWRSARAWLDGANAFRPVGAPDVSNNPPLFTLLMSPFAALDPLVGYRLWVILMVLAQACALAWVADKAGMGSATTALAVATLLASAPFLGTLAIGQMYPMLAFGLAAAWAWDHGGKAGWSGVALGLVVAIKPSLAPVLLWPLFRRRWRQFAASLAAGGAASLLGVAAIGVGPTLDLLDTLGTKFVDGSWDNASLPGLAALTLRENRFAEPLATPPHALTVAVAVGMALVALTVYRARLGGETLLWALAAAALLASPVTWHNYLPVLAPGVLLLLARGRSSAPLLIALALVPQSWTAVWEKSDSGAATLALGLYAYILFAHWLAFFVASGEKGDARPLPDEKNDAAAERV